MKEGCLQALRFVPMLCVMGAIYYLSDQPNLCVDVLFFPFADKVAHCTIYAILAVAVLYAFSESFRDRRTALVCMITLAVCTAYGVSDEFHQSFVPGRTASVADIAADVVGGCLVLLLWYWRWGRSGKQSKTVSRS